MNESKKRSHIAWRKWFRSGAQDVPFPKGAVLRVVKVDEEGSGMDWSGHLGAKVHDARRCCRNCSVIFARLGDGERIGFLHDELRPLNAEAQRGMAGVEALIAEQEAHRAQNPDVWSMAS